MPRRVDHDERRRTIAAAVWDLASTTGLEHVTLRQVAARAGVSMRLVQYYFGTRHQLLVGALAILNADSTVNATRRLERAEELAPRELLRNVLAETLPLDEQRRTRHLVHTAYFVRSLHDDELAATFRDAPHDLERLVASILATARKHSTADDDQDTTDAEALLALCDGLSTKLLLGQRNATEVLAVLDRQLDLMTGPPAGPQHTPRSF